MAKQVLTGLVGWRGMVGSVLLERMRAEGDFGLIEPVFFSTSNAGGAAPAEAKNETKLFDAYDIAALKRCEIIITAQGGEYTKKVYPELRAAGWKGYWIDAAKTLRMQDDAVIVLDPVNLNVIQDALKRGVRDYIGGNCTVSCMLMGVGRCTRKCATCCTTRPRRSWRSTARWWPGSARWATMRSPTSACRLGAA